MIRNQHTPLTLLPLGTCSADINPYQAYSSYLLKAGPHQFLLDAGSWRLLQRRWIDYSNLSAVFLTHGHVDHIAHLGFVILRACLTARRAPLHIYYPTGWSFLQLCFNLIFKFFKRNRIQFHPLFPRESSKTIYNSCGQWNLNVTWQTVIHGGLTVGYRFNFRHNSKSISIAYSPDTATFSRGAAKLGSHVDFWLLDSTFPSEMLENFEKNPRAPKFLLLHSSPGKSAQLCKKVQAKNYIIGHYYWARYSHPFIKNIMKDAWSKCKIPVILAWDLKPIHLT